jgi:hypothetical protein
MRFCIIQENMPVELCFRQLHKIVTFAFRVKRLDGSTIIELSFDITGRRH